MITKQQLLAATIADKINDAIKLTEDGIIKNKLFFVKANNEDRFILLRAILGLIKQDHHTLAKLIEKGKGKEGMTG